MVGTITTTTTINTLLPANREDTKPSPTTSDPLENPTVKGYQEVVPSKDTEPVATTYSGSESSSPVVLDIAKDDAVVVHIPSIKIVSNILEPFTAPRFHRTSVEENETAVKSEPTPAQNVPVICRSVPQNSSLPTVGGTSWFTGKRYDMRIVIYDDDSLSPLVGMDSVESDLEFSPWKWNQTMWPSEKFCNMDLKLPVVTTDSLVGLPLNFWQCGVSDIDKDLEPLQIVSVIDNDFKERWTMRVRSGSYYRFNEERYLFPDRSEIQFVDIDTPTTLTLNNPPKSGSHFRAAIWARDRNRGVFPFQTFVHRTTYSGKYNDDGELPTVDEDGNIIVANIDTTKREFIVTWSDDVALVNFAKDWTFRVGPEEIAYDAHLELCEHLGTVSINPEQTFLTSYFPISDKSNSVELYVDLKENLLLQDTDYTVDYDTGEILFINRPDVGSRLYIKYFVTIEVEYEPEYCNDYTTLPVLDLNPLNTKIGRGLVYLTENIQGPATVILESDKERISQYRYGPLNTAIGEDAEIIATVRDMDDNLLTNTRVIFEFDGPVVGTLDGIIFDGLAIKEVDRLTNTDGQAIITYTPPTPCTVSTVSIKAKVYNSRTSSWVYTVSPIVFSLV